MFKKIQRYISSVILVAILAEALPLVSPQITTVHAFVELPQTATAEESASTKTNIPTKTNPFGIGRDKQDSSLQLQSATKTKQKINPTPVTTYDFYIDQTNGQQVLFNISTDYFNWLTEMKKLDQELIKLSNEQMIKVDTVEETTKIIEKNNILLDKARTKLDMLAMEKATATFDNTNALTFFQKTIDIYRSNLTHLATLLPNAKAQFNSPCQEIPGDYIGNTNEYNATLHICKAYYYQKVEFDQLALFNKMFDYLLQKADIQKEASAPDRRAPKPASANTDGNDGSAGPGGSAGNHGDYTQGQNHDNAVKPDEPGEPTSIEENIGGSDVMTRAINLDTKSFFGQVKLFAYNLLGKYATPLIAYAITPGATVNSNSLPSTTNNTPTNNTSNTSNNNIPTNNPGNTSTYSTTTQDSSQSTTFDPTQPVGEKADGSHEIPPLEFADPMEKSIFLPTTYDQYLYNKSKDYVVDTRLYQLLYYTFQVMEMEGEAWDRYEDDDIIQKPSTPTWVKILCYRNLESSPAVPCISPLAICGLGPFLWFMTWVTGLSENIGVPYGHRAHLKVWFGLNSPLWSDEASDTKSVVGPNPHKDLKAMDVSEVGLYNERLDCAACKGLPPCIPGYLTTNGQITPKCLLYPFPCCPVLEPPLNTAVDAYLPVQVKWQNENYAEAFTNLAQGLVNEGLNQILPIDPDNNFSLQSVLGDFARQSISQLMTFDMKNFDFLDIAKGTFDNFMGKIGNQWLDSEVFSKIGLPSGFAGSINWFDPNPTGLLSNIAGGYLGDALGLDQSSISAMIMAGMEGNLTGVLGGAAGITNQLDIPPLLKQSLNVALTNAENPEAMGLSFANMGLTQLSNSLDLPQGTLDITSFSGDGWIGVANRLTQFSLSKVSGFPTDFKVDWQNPENMMRSIAISVINDKVPTPAIAEISSQIINGQDITADTILNSIANDKKLVASLFDTKYSDVGQEIFNFIQNPSDTGALFAILKNKDFNVTKEMQTAINIAGGVATGQDPLTVISQNTAEVANLLNIDRKYSTTIEEITKGIESGASAGAVAMSVISSSSETLPPSILAVVASAASSSSSSGPFDLSATIKSMPIDVMTGSFGLSDSEATKVTNLLKTATDLTLEKVPAIASELGLSGEATTLLEMAMGQDLQGYARDRLDLNFDFTGIDLTNRIQKVIAGEMTAEELSAYATSKGLKIPPAAIAILQNKSMEEVGTIASMYQMGIELTPEEINNFSAMIADGSIRDKFNDENNQTLTNARNEILYSATPIVATFNEQKLVSELPSLDYYDNAYSVSKTEVPIIMTKSADGVNPLCNTAPANASTKDQYLACNMGVMRSLNLDLKQLNIYDEENIKKLAQDPTTKLEPVTEVLPNKKYYLFPKIDLAQMIIPAYRQTESADRPDALGLFQLLTKTTDIVNISQTTPINIAFNSYLTTGRLNQFKDNFKKSFTDKFEKVVSGVPVNALANSGGASFAFDAINGISESGSADTELSFMKAGQLGFAYATVGLNMIASFDKELDISGMESKLKDAANVMAIVDSWTTGQDISQSLKTTLAFLKEKNVFDKSSDWSIDESGSITVKDINVTNIISSLENGDYFSILEEIPAVQEKFAVISEKLGGVQIGQFVDIIRNPDANKIADLGLQIMAKQISSESGQDTLATIAELKQVFYPPSVDKIPALLNSKFIKDNVLKGLDPAITGDISNVMGMILSGDITPQKAISTIMTSNFFKKMIGDENYQSIFGDYGNIVNAALSGNPQAIAASIFTNSKIAGKIDGWLNGTSVGGYISSAGIASLINGDIGGFTKSLAISFINKNIIPKIPGAYGSLISNSLGSILNGEFPTEAVTQFATQQLMSSLFGAGFPGITFSFNPSDIIINMLLGFLGDLIFKKCRKKIAQDNITHFIDIVISYDKNGDLHRWYDIPEIAYKPSGASQAEISQSDQEAMQVLDIYSQYGNDPTQLETALKENNLQNNYLSQEIIQANNSLGSKPDCESDDEECLSSYTSSQQNQATNYTQVLQDAILKYKNMRDSSTTEKAGEVLEKYYPEMRAYYPLQIFSDLNEGVQSKIKEKAEAKYSKIWAKDRPNLLNVFSHTCENRDPSAPFQNCEEYIHIGF